MEKVKNIFSPGHSKDDELMYGTGAPESNKGKVTGEGSHFGSSRGDDTAAQPNQPEIQKTSLVESDTPQHSTESNDTGLPNARKVAGQGSHFPSSEKEQTSTSTAPSTQSTKDSPKPHHSEGEPEQAPSSYKPSQRAVSGPDSSATEDASVTSIKSGIPGSQSHGPSAALESPTESSRKDNPTHGVGAEAGVGVGAGAAAAAAGKAWKPGTSDGSQPAQTESGPGMPGSFPGDEENPYKTTHIDPRVDSKPSSPALSAVKPSTQQTQPSAVTETGRDSSPDALAGQKDDSHKGRDGGIGAAVLGAVGLGGYGARKHHEGKSEAPAAPSGRSQPTAADTPASSPKPSSTPATQAKPVGTDEGLSNREGSTGEDNSHGRSPGILGAAAAAIGLGSRNARKEDNQQKPAHEDEVSKDLSLDASHPSGPSTLSNVGRGNRGDIAGAGGLENQRYDPSGTSKQHITPLGTFDQSRKDTAPPAPTETQTSPAKDDKHYGRDAGLVAGAGAAGLGTYEAGKHFGGENKSQREESPLSTGAPPDQMSLPRHNRDNSKSTLDDATAALLNRSPGGAKSKSEPMPAEERTPSKAKASNYPQQGISRDETSAPQPEKEDNHTARNTALGAAGLGAGAYGAKKLHDQHDPSQAATGDRPPGSQTDNWPLKEDSTTYGTTPRQAQPVGARQAKGEEQRSSPEQEDHTARNTALAGAAGTGAAAYAGHEYSQHEAEKLEKERLKEEKAHEKELAKQQAQEQKEHDKAAAKEAKKHEKEDAKEEKKAEKEAAKAEKKHEKEVAKEEKKHEKEVAAAEKKHEKEVAAAEMEREKQAREVEKKHEKEAAAATMAAAEEKERKEQREKLEKEAREKGARERETREAEEKEKEQGKRHNKEGAAAATGIGAAAAGAVAYEATSEDKQPETPDSPSAKSISSHSQGGESTDKKERHGLRRVLHKIAHPGEKDDDHHRHQEVEDSPSDSQHHEGRHKLHKDPPPDIVKERYSGDQQTPSYADYAVKEDQHQGAKTIGGGHIAPGEAEDPNKYPPRQAEETSPLMDKEAHYLAGRFADTDIEERIHHSLNEGP